MRRARAPPCCPRACLGPGVRPVSSPPKTGRPPVPAFPMRSPTAARISAGASFNRHASGTARVPSVTKWEWASHLAGETGSVPDRLSRPEEIRSASVG